MTWKHPKYYKELEKIRKEHEKKEAASAKLTETQASSGKPQATS